MKKLLLICALMVGALYSTLSLAVCTLTSQWNLTVSLGSMTVQRDAPVGSIIGTRGYANTNESAICDASTSRYRTLTYQGGVQSSVSNVYNTNIPGVGIQLINTFSNPAEVWNWTRVDSSTPSLKATHHDITVNIIKTGPVTSGVLSTGEIGNEKFSTAGSYITTEIINMGAGNSVTALACSIVNTNIPVPLDDVLGASLTGVGTTAKRKDFSVGLSCDAGARINVTLAGQQHSDTSATGVLQLSNPLSASTATGVGIQMLYNNSPMPLNTNLVLKTSSGGAETFPFSAQYYQTRSSVTTGTANATATLNITYQ